MAGAATEKIPAGGAGGGRDLFVRNLTVSRRRSQRGSANPSRWRGYRIGLSCWLGSNSYAPSEGVIVGPPLQSSTHLPIPPLASPLPACPSRQTALTGRADRSAPRSPERP